MKTLAAILLLISTAAAQEPLTFKQLKPTVPRSELQNRILNALDIGIFEPGRISAHDIPVLTRAISSAKSSTDTIFRVDHLDDPTLWSLETPINTFERFNDKYKTGTAITLDIVNDVTYASTDLAVKASFLKANQQGTGIEVQVETLKDGKIIPGNDIFYAQYTNPKKRVRFDKLSTATDMVPPGHYWIWSELEGTAARQVEFHCGDDGRQRREIQIPSP